MSPPVFFFSVSRYICRSICVRVNCVIDLDHFFFLYESWNSRQFQPILLALRVLKQKNDDDVEKKRLTNRKQIFFSSGLLFSSPHPTHPLKMEILSRSHSI